MEHHDPPDPPSSNAATSSTPGGIHRTTSNPRNQSTNTTSSDPYRSFSGSVSIDDLEPADGLVDIQVNTSRQLELSTTNQSMIGGGESNRGGELYEEADNTSQSSISSTPVPFGDNSNALALNFSALRRIRGRKRRGTLMDVNIGKKFAFARSVKKFIGKQSLRKRAAERNIDVDGNDESAYSFLRTTTTTATTAIDKANEKDFYFRALFYTEYDDDPRTPPPPIDTESHDSIVVDNDEDDGDSNSTTTNGFVGNQAVFTDDVEMDQALSKFLDGGLTNFLASYEDTLTFINSIGPDVERSEENTDSFWRDRIIPGGCTPAHGKLIDRIGKLLNDVQCTNLVAVGNPDEYMMRVQSIKRATPLLRQYFATAIASNGISVVGWAHWELLKHLPIELAVWYLMVLRELYAKCPEIIYAAITSDDSIDSDTIESIREYLVEPKPLMMSSDIILRQQPPPRLPNDPILMLVSTMIKAHSDQLAHESTRSRYFYKNLFPNLGFCMDVKFAPFKRAMLIATCADQLCASLRDKIREVQYFHANRPIILIGWETAALVALKVALEKSVAAVVCMGFPNVSLFGPRDSPDDELLNVSCPTLFVVGQFSATTSLEELVEMRKQMKSDKTGLIVVGGADDELKMSETKLSSENLCQEVVDRCILESVGEFLCSAMETYVETSEETAAVAGPVSTQLSKSTDIEMSLPAKRKRASVHDQMSTSSSFDMRNFGSTKIRANPKEKVRVAEEVKSTPKPKSHVADGTSGEKKAKKPQPPPPTTSTPESVSSTVAAILKMAETPASTSKVVTTDSISNTSGGDDPHLPTTTSTRTRQIRKPAMLDL